MSEKSEKSEMSEKSKNNFTEDQEDYRNNLGNGYPYEFADRFYTGLFCQWLCDIHEDCCEDPDDKLFCPTGCTYMQINNNSRLKWPAGPAADGRNEACDCEDDKTCIHFIPEADYKNLKDGDMVFAIWPFDDCHYYEARVCRLQWVQSFPSKYELERIPKSKKSVKGRRSAKIRKLEETGGIYTEYNPEFHEVKINKNAKEFTETQEILKQVEKEGDVNYTAHLARLCYAYTELKQRVQELES